MCDVGAFSVGILRLIGLACFPGERRTGRGSGVQIADNPGGTLALFFQCQILTIELDCLKCHVLGDFVRRSLKRLNVCIQIKYTSHDVKGIIIGISPLVAVGEIQLSSIFNTQRSIGRVVGGCCQIPFAGADEFQRGSVGRTCITPKGDVISAIVQRNRAGCGSKHTSACETGAGYRGINISAIFGVNSPQREVFAVHVKLVAPDVEVANVGVLLCQFHVPFFHIQISVLQVAGMGGAVVQF